MVPDRWDRPLSIHLLDYEHQLCATVQWWHCWHTDYYRDFLDIIFIPIKWQLNRNSWEGTCNVIYCVEWGVKLYTLTHCDVSLSAQLLWNGTDASDRVRSPPPPAAKAIMTRSDHHEWINSRRKLSSIGGSITEVWCVGAFLYFSLSPATFFPTLFSFALPSCNM